ncbi:zinc finger protein ztf-16 [Diorhabda carinulata]|uniref:zinc finger protein ztf-16 n=1 Tax=Diorhabda sublineata TaxID=1163346 RepID=UPI0024E12594|nr:zinc finger protein ztf-16 [Diorhabda sublineata]XP_056643225.1 zinc finger protein ztf-16 [Diorhabda sublineata]XP_056643234.1 zinc finger protein ztf-16 [Diorhabda sublineata]XP_057669182.1 zinc finger protein ztf-16 [Diorhabda carinulata]XP_057669183.1 zinc finger protein ztf-16 [Diorhabda carinulata]XP_057669184.1 zinc finger protein ztf-16 [Diorhabda carinulata]
MANTAAENEADSGSGVVTTHVTPKEEDADQNEADRLVTGSNINYDTTEIFKCIKCDFEANTQVQLTLHVTKVHTTNEASAMEVENNNPPPDRAHRKMFECDVCNMKFSNGANMRRHKMRHTGVKPYECRVCQKRFFRKDHLAEHFTTHTKTLPYHCPICNRGFQRQIAMRAHFQNEHVGQHDLVKSCPLCSYRAGSMKSLRIHFFNRHGIDLDNPGPAGSQASLIAAAAQQGFAMDGTLNSLSQFTGSLSVSVTGGANYSDSGDSTGARSTDNATPPMHFLTPHVEISMTDAPVPVFSPSPGDQQNSNQPGQSSDPQRVNGDCPNSPQSADSNSNAPSSSHIQPNSLRIDQETSITPSISLIPIKQEPTEEYEGAKRNGPVNLSTSPSGSIQMQSATSSSLSSLIKVSPLKSLLRDDLKRKIISRNGSSSRGRSTASPGANSESPNDPATTTNGTITSTGLEQPSDSSLWTRMSKRALNGLQCIFCGIGFPDQTLYFLHKGCHSDANPWKCNICGEQCSNVYEFNSHLLSKSHQ